VATCVAEFDHGFGGFSLTEYPHIYKVESQLQGCKDFLLNNLNVLYLLYLRISNSSIYLVYKKENAPSIPGA
jgi:hypothetical protein